MPNIVIIGKRGQLAQSLRRLEWPRDCTLRFVGSEDIPVGDPARGVEVAIEKLQPDLVLNAAAYTNVDRAEIERAEASQLNVEMPLRLAEMCRERDIPLIHVSTDYVFDGEKRTPYLETDTPNPLSVYAATKLDGDRAVEQARLRRWAILRSSWVISEIGETFPVKILRRARQGEALRVVDDQFGCPTAAGDLALAMQNIGGALLDGDQSAIGLFNFCGASQMSWYGLTGMILKAAEAAGLKRPPLIPITTTELNVPARRPAYSALNCERIAQTRGIVGVGIEVDVGRMVRCLLKA